MLKKICNILSTLLMIILVMVAAILFVPRFLGYEQYAVLSGSMEPTIHVGAIAYDKAFDQETLAVGDVITYQLSEDTLVTHRVVAIDEESQTVTTKGDANENEDGMHVAFSNIVGVVAFSVPYIGYISIYGRTPLGITAVCAIVIILIILNFLPDILEESMEGKKAKKEHDEQEN